MMTRVFNRVRIGIDKNRVQFRDTKPDVLLRSFLNHSGTCTRCGGLLVRDAMDGLAQEFYRGVVTAFRCIQCGDVIDPVILNHRGTAVSLDGR